MVLFIRFLAALVAIRFARRLGIKSGPGLAVVGAGGWLLGPPLVHQAFVSLSPGGSSWSSVVIVGIFVLFVFSFGWFRFRGQLAALRRSRPQTTSVKKRMEGDWP